MIYYNKIWLWFCFSVVPGPVLSLSTQCIRDCEQVKLLALCAGRNEHNESGSLLTVLSLSTRSLIGILSEYIHL